MTVTVAPRDRERRNWFPVELLLGPSKAAAEPKLGRRARDLLGRDPIQYVIGRFLRLGGSEDQELAIIAKRFQ